jgi:DNA invertase Pin-like site-specific DNA recombinase
MGQRIGYIRVSTEAQHVDRRLDGVVVDRSFTDKVSGKDINRPAVEQPCARELESRQRLSGEHSSPRGRHHSWST